MSDDSFPNTPVQVLVVCTANVARSPLARAMLADRLRAPQVSFASAGTHARPGQPAAERSQALAADRGLDLSSHSATLLTAELIERSHLVLTMTEEHRDACGLLVPGAGARTFTFRELVRLLEEVSHTGTPVTTADRLLWLRRQAHFARPRSVRPPRPEDVADPLGGDPAVWQELGAQLDALVDRLVDTLR